MFEELCALIADLYHQIRDLRVENAELRTALELLTTSGDADA